MRRVPPPTRTRMDGGAGGAVVIYVERAIVLGGCNQNCTGVHGKSKEGGGGEDVAARC